MKLLVAMLVPIAVITLGLMAWAVSLWGMWPIYAYIAGVTCVVLAAQQD